MNQFSLINISSKSTFLLGSGYFFSKQAKSIWAACFGIRVHLNQ